MSRGKQLPPPSGGAGDLTAILRSRHVSGDGDQEQPTAPPAPRTPDPKPRTAPARPAMDRRSWYMPKATAERLAEAVEELHFKTRQPKHVILAALIGVALENIADAEKDVALLARVRREAANEQ